MKNVLSLLIVGILVISGFGAVAISDVDDKYLFTKVYTFPAGTKISDYTIDLEIEEHTLVKKIQPSPQPVPVSDLYASEILSYEVLPDEMIYSSSDFYPSEPYSVNIGVGLEDREHVIFVNVRCYSQYSPLNDILNVPKNIDIEIEYTLPEEPLFTADEYDMLIITDESFLSNLQPLVDHKNSNGVETKIETVQEIYSAYNGRDEVEDIKFRIKDAIEELGIKYVLLAGGRQGQSLNWYVPPRRTNNDDGWETGYDSDLYFADIYKYNGEEIVFEDWDSNGNGVFAEDGNFLSRDVMDFYPDVTVGRLPLRSVKDADSVVNKIINYENNADDSWFKTGVVISGDTFPPSRGGAPGWWEGELETGVTVDILESSGFTMKKLWLSIPGAWEGRDDVINAFNEGAGFVHFAGHSNPASWGNHPPDDEDHVFYDGFKMWDGPKLTNDGELPIVVFGGCHSAQFNVTLMHLITGMQKYGFMGFWFRPPYRYAFFEWVPRDKQWSNSLYGKLWSRIWIR